jgi:hypothetical protein
MQLILGIRVKDPPRRTQSEKNTKNTKQEKHKEQEKHKGHKGDPTAITAL